MLNKTFCIKKNRLKFIDRDVLKLRTCETSISCCLEIQVLLYPYFSQSFLVDHSGTSEGYIDIYCNDLILSLGKIQWGNNWTRKIFVATWDFAG